ncbi:hypothetical protein NL676_031394 [Syzygium grande]|nr:hypothetical protein NL676_031394 [Syzygium grande]
MQSPRRRYRSSIALVGVVSAEAVRSKVRELRAKVERVPVVIAGRRRRKGRRRRVAICPFSRRRVAGK